MSFAQPLALLALVAVPLLLVLWIGNERRRRASAARFSTLALLPNLVPRPPGRLRYIPLGLLLLALTAMIVGAARPHAHISVPRKEATVVLAIDVSRSMTATDVKPSRLDAARAAGDAFLAKVPSTYNIALVAFASRAFLAVPPTTDHDLVRKGLPPRQGGARHGLDRSRRHAERDRDREARRRLQRADPRAAEPRNAAAGRARDRR